LDDLTASIQDKGLKLPSRIDFSRTLFMHRKHRLLPITILAFVALAVSASAGGVGVLYLKNNGAFPADIWVNGVYQGYVPAGQARQTVKEGFVTNDSGFQPDGKLKQTYSHGGWESNSDTVEVVFQSVDNKNRVYRGSITVGGDVEHKGYVWFGESEAGKEPESVVWENDAAPIPNASAHYTASIKEVYRLYAETKGIKSGSYVAVYELDQPIVKGKSMDPSLFTPACLFRVYFDGTKVISTEMQWGNQVESKDANWTLRGSNWVFENGTEAWSRKEVITMKNGKPFSLLAYYRDANGIDTPENGTSFIRAGSSYACHPKEMLFRLEQ
jgi:hypothetical protein